MKVILSKPGKRNTKEGLIHFRRKVEPDDDDDDEVIEPAAQRQRVDALPGQFHD